LPSKKFEYEEIPELAETAQTWYKEKKFMPTEGQKLSGYVPPMSIYNQ